MQGRLEDRAPDHQSAASQDLNRAHNKIIHKIKVSDGRKQTNKQKQEAKIQNVK